MPVGSPLAWRTELTHLAPADTTQVEARLQSLFNGFDPRVVRHRGQPEAELAGKEEALAATGALDERVWHEVLQTAARTGQWLPASHRPVHVLQGKIKQLNAESQVSVLVFSSNSILVMMA